MTGLKDDAEKGWSSWVLRPIVLFAAVYMVIGIVHEFSHAITAYSLGIPFTLLHLHVNLNRTIGTGNQRAIIGVAGPLVALWSSLLDCIYKSARFTLRSALAVRGMVWRGHFLWQPYFNCICRRLQSFGDDSSVVQYRPVRYQCGRCGELMQLVLSRGKGVTRVGACQCQCGEGHHWNDVIPAVVGTAILLLMFLPMPLTYAYGRIAESLFWIPACIAALIKQEPNMTAQRKLQFGWGDVVLFLLAAAVVRLMAAGITVQP